MRFRLDYTLAHPVKCVSCLADFALLMLISRSEANPSRTLQATSPQLQGRRLPGCISSPSSLVPLTAADRTYQIR
jgi:hypothetical protein